MNRARRALAVGIVTMGLAVAAGATSETTSPAPDLATVRQAATNLAVPFEENRGQFEPEVAYLAKTFAGSVFVTREGQLVYSLPGRELAAASDSPAAKPDRRERRQAERGPGWALGERLLGAGPLSPEGAEAAVTHVTRFTPAGTFQADTWERVRLGEAWTGIEVELAARGQNFEKLFHLAPGADPARIRVGLRGAERLAVADDGRLVVTTGNGDLAYTAPVAWQEIGGERRAVEVRYALLEPTTDSEEKAYGFALGAYDPQQPLTIDPLIQSTYLGGSESDLFSAVALLAGGDVLVAGFTDSPDFPKRTGGAQPTYSGGLYDGFIARLSGDLRTLVQSTYLGGTKDDRISALEPNEAGGFSVVWVGGWTTSANFPGVTSSSPQPIKAGGVDGFVSLLTADLKNLVKSTYFGGNGEDHLDALTLAADGDILVGGWTKSTDLPKSANGAQPAYSGNADGFVARIKGDMSQIRQSTYLGGSESDFVTTLAVAGNGDVVVGGQTSSDGLLGAVFNSAQQFRAGEADGFVSRLAGNLKSVVRSTYVGGNSLDALNTLIVTSSGGIWAGGGTRSTDLRGVSSWSPQPENGGDLDGFVSNLSGDLTSYVMTTYLGGSGWDEINALVEVPSGLWRSILVAGTTESTDLPGIRADSAQAIHGGGFDDGFLSYLSQVGNFWTIKRSTYLGAEGRDKIVSMARTPRGEVVVGGDTDSLDLPGRAGGAQPNYGGGAFDAYLALLTEDLKASLFEDGFETGNICRWDAARGASGTPCN
ncbi:MAG TPA: hypothetical protein PKM64_01355 [Thermoanaerobaculia bacterium]|nr:hypothetical protein [Thermoanaerobaculia bacterium]